jgi:hypothetical protein
MKKLFVVIALLWPFSALAETLPPMTVWKSPSCGCCGKWVEHMKAAGFKVETQNTDQMHLVKRQARIADELQSCHTAIVDGYLIEGHVPAKDIKRLLKEKTKVRGLAVPGMPSGSPGMEDGTRDPYEVVTFDKNGKTTVYNKY